MFNTAFQVVYLVTVMFLPNGEMVKTYEKQESAEWCELLKYQRSFQVPGRFILVCETVEEREA